MSEELIQAADERIADLLEPISGGVGEDVSYDEKFDEIRNETEKMQSLSGGTVDWGAVAVSAEEILQDKSKDFRVACYLATCKMRNNLEGVLDGVLLITRIVEKYWDEMYPPLKRMKARAGMVEWMSEQSGPIVKDFKLTAADGPLVKTLEETSKALDELLRDKMGDKYPSMRELRNGVRHLDRTVPKEKPKPPPKPEPEKAPEAAQQPAAQAAAPAAAAPPPPPPPPPPPAAAPVQVATVDAAGAKEAMKALGGIGRNLVKLANVMRGEKPDSHIAYRIARFGMWIEVVGAPPVNDGKTMVPPPAPHVRQRLDSLAAAQDWLALVNEAETAACDNILWLDPHRYVATGMSALGVQFNKCKGEMLTQTALHLKRVPTMAKLAFSDGTPFADGQTQMWIENEVMPVLASGEGGGGGGPASVLDEPLKEAQGLAMKGELGKALEVVAAAAAGAPTPSERFRGKLALAQLCLSGGQHEIAKSALAGLTGEIDKHDLTTWDPGLCSDFYACLYAATKGVNDNKRPKGQLPPPVPGQPPPPGPSDEDLAAEAFAFERLCQLDPAAALKLAGSGKK